MEPATISTKQIFKIVVIFTLISLGVDVVRKVLYAQGDLDRIVSSDSLLAIVLETAFEFITGLVAFYIVKAIKSSGLGMTLLKAFIFSLVYCTVSLIACKITYFAFGIGFGFHFKPFETFLNYIPFGFMQGIFFMLVVTKLTTHSENDKNKSNNNLLDT